MHIKNKHTIIIETISIVNPIALIIIISLEILCKKIDKITPIITSNVFPIISIILLVSITNINYKTSNIKLRVNSKVIFFIN